MNAVIALCHFCEIHGPRVLFCTQAHHATEPHHVLEEKGGDQNFSFGHHYHRRPRSSTNESLSSGHSDRSTYSSSSTDCCEACRSFQPDQPGFISNDYEAHISYVSSQNPEHPELFTVIRQACIRSLSCEVCQGREGPIFFGDDHHGYTLSYTFFIKDSQARGLQRLYSIIIVMMDRIYLLNSWPFLVKHMKSLIDELQGKAVQVYKHEQAQKSQRADRLNREFLSPGDFYRGGVNKPFRALVVLTGDQNLFRYLHMKFAWILKAGGNRMVEKVLEGPPQEQAVDLDDQEVTEEGFIKVSTKPMTAASEGETSQQEGHQSEEELDGDEGPVFSSLQHFRAVLGSLNFHDVAYNVLIGNQLIVRCDFKSTLKSLFKMLKAILPAGCCRIIRHSATYQDSWKCNFLGLSSKTQLPNHVSSSELYLLLDIISPDKLRQDSNKVVSKMAGSFMDYGISIASSTVVPDKVPAILTRLEAVLDHRDLTPEIVDTILVTLKEEWMNKVKLLFKFTRAGSHSEDDVEKLLKILEAKEEDKSLLKFWITGLSSQYRSHLLSSTMGMGQT